MSTLHVSEILLKYYPLHVAFDSIDRFALQTGRGLSALPSFTAVSRFRVLLGRVKLVFHDPSITLDSRKHYWRYSAHRQDMLFGRRTTSLITQPRR